MFYAVRLFMEMQQAIQVIVRGFEAAGIGALVIGSLLALAAFARILLGRRRVPSPRLPYAYRGLRRGLGRAILLGLELLVAADIIRSVAVAPNLQNVIVLGLIVLIRTFLSFSLELEITGRWPWERATGVAPAPTPEDPGTP